MYFCRQSVTHLIFNITWWKHSLFDFLQFIGSRHLRHRARRNLKGTEIDSNFLEWKYTYLIWIQNICVRTIFKLSAKITKECLQNHFTYISPTLVLNDFFLTCFSSQENSSHKVTASFICNKQGIENYHVNCFKEVYEAQVSSKNRIKTLNQTFNSMWQGSR